MPKYRPTYEDLYEQKQCAWCGKNFVAIEGEGHCSPECERDEATYHTDMEWFLLNDWMEEEY